MTAHMFPRTAQPQVLKHADWAETDSSADHYRRREDEVDMLLESRAGERAMDVIATWE